MKKEETIQVPVWMLKQFANTLRMTSNVLGSPKRESCLNRNIMRDWNTVVDLINGETASMEEQFDYYSKSGQTPKIINE